MAAAPSRVLLMVEREGRREGRVCKDTRKTAEEGWEGGQGGKEVSLKEGPHDDGATRRNSPQSQSTGRHSTRLAAVPTPPRSRRSAASPEQHRAAARVKRQRHRPARLRSCSARPRNSAKPPRGPCPPKSAETGSQLGRTRVGAGFGGARPEHERARVKVGGRAAETDRWCL